VRTCTWAVVVSLLVSPALADTPRAKIKVEQAVAPGEATTSRRVRFEIAITNTGPEMIHNVIVRAKLSEGLRHEHGDDLEQSLESIKPGERITLDGLAVDALVRGEQSCSVVVSSPNAADARSTRRVIVK